MRTREKGNDLSLALGISPRLRSGPAWRGPNAAQAPQRGVALFLAIFALLLLSAIGLAMMFSSDTETTISINYRDKQSAIYGALAGLQEARDRIQPLTGDLGPGTNLSNGGLNIVPTALPSTGAANVLYIINPAPGETVAPWDWRNKYFDTELCHEPYFANSPNPGVTAGTPGVPCPATSASVPSGNAWYAWYDNSQKKYFTASTSGTGSGGAATIASAYQLTAGSAKIPLTYKWVRITLKSDNMTPVSVTGGTSGSSSQLCWDQNAFREKPLPGGYNPDCTPITGGITNIPVASNGAGYTSAPTVTITGGSGSGATAVATIGQLPAGITSVTLTNPGAGYTSVPAVTVAPTDLLGTGAIVNATLNATDPVSSVTPTGSTWASPPACYPIGSVPTVSFNPAGATATVAMTGSSCIYSFGVSGNCSSKNLSNVPVTASNGSGTVAFSGTIGSKSNKNATSPTVSNPGSYTTLPTTFSGGTQCPAVTITPTYGIQINTVTVTAGGSYQVGNPPSVTIGGVTTVGGSPSATANLSGTANPGPVASLIIPVGGNGSGYDLNPVPLIIAPPCTPLSACGGVQATGYASITPDKGVLSIQVTNAGSGYSNANPPTVTITGGGGSGALSGTPNIGSAATSSYMGRVYLLTALAATPSGSRAMAQMEAGVSHDQFNFGLGGALTLIGPSPGYGTPHSMPFQIIGNDCPTCAPAPSGCPNPTTANPATDAIGVYDPTNATNPSAVQTVINSLAKPQNYIGVNSAPDVHNANLGDPTASTLDAIVDTIANSMAGPSNTYGTRAAPVNNPTLNNMGTAANPAYNVVYGNYSMGPTTGYGILVVTGTLTFSGNYSWNGLILVIGAGASIMNGGGNGQITGAVYVANTSSGSLGSPNVNWSGGGGNGIQYDHCWADYMESLIPPLPPSIDPNPLKVISLRTEVY